MHRSSTFTTIVITTAAGWLAAPPTLADDPAPVRFDLPPVVAAVPAADPYDPKRVTVELLLSSMIESPDVPRIDQWLVRCQPRDHAVQIKDYSPRTETASELATPIQVKQTREQSNSFGLSLDGGYGPAVRGNAGMDHARKDCNSLQFDRVAPEQAVTAAGTINRGRGVYFKLRWTAQQVLEGEKVFRLTLAVPRSWRGSLLDVSVVAQSEHATFAGWDREIRTIGAANFVVAVHRQGDSQAAALAGALADAEHALRSATSRQPTTAALSLPSMLRQFAVKLDREPAGPEDDWLARLLVGRADPHLDKQISKLPMSVRVAVLDYADIRDEFAAINDAPAARVSAARQALE